MNIAHLTGAIMASLETCESADDMPVEIDSIIWANFSQFLNTAWKMRKFQKQFFQHKDKRSLEESKKLEKQFDELLKDLEKQKTQPQLKL